MTTTKLNQAPSHEHDGSPMMIPMAQSPFRTPPHRGSHLSFHTSAASLDCRSFVAIYMHITLLHSLSLPRGSRM